MEELWDTELSNKIIKKKKNKMKTRTYKNILRDNSLQMTFMNMCSKF